MYCGKKKRSRPEISVNDRDTPVIKIIPQLSTPPGLVAQAKIPRVKPQIFLNFADNSHV